MGFFIGKQKTHSRPHKYKVLMCFFFFLKYLYYIYPKNKSKSKTFFHCDKQKLNLVRAKIKLTVANGNYNDIFCYASLTLRCPLAVEASGLRQTVDRGRSNLICSFQDILKMLRKFFIFSQK